LWLSFELKSGSTSGVPNRKEIPMFVYDQTPPGVPEMRRLAKQIRYQFHETDQGGEVEIISTSAEAIRAIHDFLVFQIREHKTGDPSTIP
jgi:hypothetical protein